MAQVRVLRSDDFTGGLNLRADPFQLGDNESPDLLNVDIDPRGGFFQRGAFTRYNTAAIGAIASGSFTAEKLYYWQTAVPQVLVAANGKVFAASSTTFADTTITTTSSEGASFAPWAGSSSSVVYVACGMSTAQASKWDGTTKTLLTASTTAQWQESLASPTGTHMPRADLVATHVDRMWVASTYEAGAGYPNRVRFSHPNFPESWRSQDYIDVVGGGSGITALVPFGGALLVFKKTSVHAIYGYDTDTFQLVTLSDSIGAATSHCVAASERGVYFFSWPDGLYFYDGNGFADLFDKIRPLVTLGDVNSAAIDKVWVSQCANRIWLSLPTGAATTPSYTFVFDPSIKAWTRYQAADGKGLACLTDFVSSSGQRYPLALHPTKPWVLRVDQFGLSQDDTDGTAANMVSYYTTKWQDAGVVSARKMWRRPDFVVKQPSVDTTLTVQVFHDWEEAQVQRTALVTVSAGAQNSLVWNAVGTEPDGINGWGQAPWGANAEGAQFQRGSNLGLARAVQMKISGEAGKTWGVNSISYKYIPRRVR